jgi:hypothetical protein
MELVGPNWHRLFRVLMAGFVSREFLLLTQLETVYGATGGLDALFIVNFGLCNSYGGSTCYSDNNTGSVRDLFVARGSSFTVTRYPFFFEIFFKLFAPGQAYNSANGINYWSLAFGNDICPQTIFSKIYSGSHLFYGPNIFFIATFYDTQAPTETVLVLDNVDVNLTLEIGNASTIFFCHVNNIFCTGNLEIL